MIDIDDPCFVFYLGLDGEGGANVPSDEGEPAWLHIDYSAETAEAWLKERQLDQHIVDALIRTDTRPRTVSYKSGILVLIRAINMNAGSDPEDMVSLRMWIEPNRLITVRQRRIFSVQDVKNSLEQGEGPKTIPDVIMQIIERTGDRVADFIEEIEGEIEHLEADVEKEKTGATRDLISGLRRKIAVVRRYMAPQREALESLYRLTLDSAWGHHSFAAREQADRFIRYVEDLDLNRERTLVLQEELMNLIMEQQNSRMYTLSIVAVIFLPITFVSGVFGMNVAGLPGLSDPNAFTYVALGMSVVSLLLIAYLVVRKWL